MQDVCISLCLRAHKSRGLTCNSNYSIILICKDIKGLKIGLAKFKEVRKMKKRWYDKVPGHS